MRRGANKWPGLAPAVWCDVDRSAAGGGGALQHLDLLQGGVVVELRANKFSHGLEDALGHPASRDGTLVHDHLLDIG